MDDTVSIPAARSCFGEHAIIGTDYGGLIAAPVQIGNEIEQLAFSAAED